MFPDFSPETTCAPAGWFWGLGSQISGGWAAVMFTRNLWILLVAGSSECWAGVSSHCGVGRCLWYGPAVGERKGRENWKQMWSILALELVPRLLDVTVERPPCVLPALGPLGARLFSPDGSGGVQA